MGVKNLAVGVKDYRQDQTRRSRRSWLKVAAVCLLVLGIIFRFVNIDRKVYWVDEVYTSLRVSGYTEQEFIEQVFTGEPIRVADLRKYQHPNPEKDLGDSIQALTGNAEHSPLYFLMLRFWMQTFGDSVKTIRTLSVLISLVAFPCLYWLCRELFDSPVVAWIALSWFAVTPVQVLYAQEARQYSLWIVAALLSSAALLRARRVQTQLSWVAYSASIALGLYTHLLFGLVAIAHAIYILLLEKLRLSRTTISYVLAAGGGLLAFLPWLVVVIKNIGQIRTTTNFLTENHSFSDLLDNWFLDINRALLDRQLDSFNILLVLLAIYGLYYLCRKTPTRTWLLVLSLAGCSFLGLALPDLLLGGQRSMQVRYLLPFYLLLQIALSYLFTQKAIQLKTWGNKAWRLVLIGLITAGIVACSISSQAEVWWNKSLPKSFYYPEVAARVNQSDRPLLISDGSPVGVLSLSHLLKDDVTLQLVTHARQLQSVAEGFDNAFLLTPSRAMNLRIRRSMGYRLVRLYRSPNDGKVYLWRLQERKARPRRVANP